MAYHMLLELSRRKNTSTDWVTCVPPSGIHRVTYVLVLIAHCIKRLQLPCENPLISAAPHTQTFDEVFPTQCRNDPGSPSISIVHKILEENSPGANSIKLRSTKIRKSPAIRHKYLRTQNAQPMAWSTMPENQPYLGCQKYIPRKANHEKRKFDPSTTPLLSKLIPSFTGTLIVRLVQLDYLHPAEDVIPERDTSEGWAVATAPREPSETPGRW